MKYLSTRGAPDRWTFKQAVMTGLAPDGGLLLPEAFPDVRAQLPAWSKLSYADLAFEIMSLYADDFSPAELRAIIEKSYATPTVFRAPEVAPLVQAGPVAVCELFHGPTLAFKDVALQFLGNCFEKILAEQGGEINIVAATSGDTGSAAIHGLRGRKNINVFILHPAGRVSPVQEMQMTSVLDDNVFNIALDGTFDDAQAIVKHLFNDLPFKAARRLGAVNSINWARILAQIVYYFYAAFRALEAAAAGRESCACADCAALAKKVSFTVPTGNFGDIFAGYAAARMGLPIRKLILATNENDILARYFKTGVYSKSAVAQTISPSMDIQIASNFERWLYLRANRDPELLKKWMTDFAATGILQLAPNDPLITAERADTEQTLATIKRFHEDYGYLADPHTAVGITAALPHIVPNEPMICLATAHPGKFPDAIAAAIGDAAPAAAPEIKALKGLPTRKTNLPNDAQAIADFITERT